MVSMENSPIVVFPRLRLLLLFTCLVCIITNPTTKPTVFSLTDQRLAMRLIHRDSIFSPFYNRSSTISDLVSFAMESSMERYAYLKAKSSGAFLPHDDIRGSLAPNDRATILFVNISIGTPPVPQLVVMDTSSHLFWVQCEPCQRCNRKTPNPVYDPRNSSSYLESSCLLTYCNRLIRGTCDSGRKCTYYVLYKDLSYSSGVVGHENVTFQTANESSVVVPFVRFGCATDSEERNLPQSSGVLGLGAYDASLIQYSIYKNSSKFSYCIGNISDPTYMYNRLSLGDGTILEGLSTTFDARNELYYVSIEGISFGQTEIKINPVQYKFNVLIDSATTLTYLPRGTYELLKAEVRKILDEYLVPVIFSNPDYLCYEGDIKRDLKRFPVGTFRLIFRLAGGAEITVDKESLFHKVNPDDFCMTVAPAKDDKTIVIGLLAQQYHNIGFDLFAKTIYFQRIDCQLLDS